MKKSRFTEEQMRKMTMAALLGAAFLFAPALCAAQAISPSGKPLSLPLATVPDNEAEDLAPLPKAAAPAIPAQATAVGQWVGVTAHQTDLVNQGGITGAGVKVCVIADGVDGLSGYQTSGDAPAVTIPSGFQGSGSTGTLMLLAIHQMAPNAQLAFASGQFGSLVSAINALKPLGCHIMVDAALFEPGRAFQLPFSSTAAIDSVVAQGTTYITAAGDGGNAQNGTSGTYEGDFTPWTGTPPTGWANGTLFHSFNGRPYLTLDTATTSVSLEWDDPDGSPSMADYDLYVTDPTGTSLVAYGNNTQPTAQPVESTTCGVICHFAEGSRVYVVKYAGDARMLRIRTDSNRGTVTPSTTRAIQGHRAWPNAMTVAAVYPPTSCASYACQAPGFFQTPLSSDGYRQLFFTPHGQAFTPGNYLLGTGGGLGYIKPDIAAATSGAFNAPSPFFFNGSTAGAAASAAGLAALVKSAYPSAPVNFVRQALWINAFSFGFTVPNAGMGYGVTTAPVAVKNVLSPIVANNAYGPSFAAAGSIVQYDVSLTNPNQVTLTNVTYSDNLAAPIAASPNLITSGCAASVTANPGGTSFGITSLTIPAGTTCSFRISVQPTTAGSVVVTPPALVNTPFGLVSSTFGARLETAAAGVTNVAAAASGSTVTTSSSLDGQHPASSIIDGDRAGTNWGAGGGWADAMPSSYPDTIDIDFGTARTIDRVIVYTLQDDWRNPIEPTDSLTFASFGVQDFDVQAWDGAHWLTVGVVRGNNLVRRVVQIPPTTTSKIRLSILRAAGGVSTVTEIEAWSTTATSANLTQMGVLLSASSTYTSAYPGLSVYALIDGAVNGAGWPNGGGWADNTPDVFPDWVLIDFEMPRTLDHVTVYTLQDQYLGPNPADPTPTTTFSLWGVTDYVVDGWNGVTWDRLGEIHGNNHVISTATFAPYQTQKIRISVTGALNGLSRLTEIQAWSTSAAPVRRLSNVALASTGAVAIASSSAGAGFAPAAAIDGDPSGSNWTNGGGWADGTIDMYPDTLEIDLNGSFDIDNVVVYSLQDDWQHPVPQPSDTMTFTQYGLLDFHVDAWDGAQWVTLGTVTGNNLVKRTVSFPTFTTTKVRVVVTNALVALSLRGRQDDRPRRRLHGAGQLAEPRGARGRDDLHAIRRDGLHGPGLGRRAMGHARDGDRQQPRQAHGAIHRLHDQRDPRECHECPLELQPHHRGGGVGRAGGALGLREGDRCQRLAVQHVPGPECEL